MNKNLQNSYDSVAGDYAANFRDEMSHKPFDRKMLDFLIEKNDNRGMICDLGCGPGQIAGYLFERGATVCGVDLSAKMVEEARKLNPEIEFYQGNMLALDSVGENSYAGIAAFYSIVHVPRAKLGRALKELKRVLGPGGILLLAFHIGQEVAHLDEWWDKKVSIDFTFYETAEMKENLLAVGFALEEIIERDPYAEIEYQSRRAYIFARKP